MNYKGGKNSEGVAQWIINQMPPHDDYIEAFAGSAAVLRMKRPAIINIAIEIDGHVAQDLLSYFSVMPAVDVVCDDALHYLRKMRCTRSTLIYLDPPYLRETRRWQGPIYRHEFWSVEEHTKLLKILLKLPCMVAISGYRSSLYDAMLAGWRRTEKHVTLRNGLDAMECLWMNYPEPVALHDYRFLGNNFRERERLKRIKQNWSRRLLSMPLLERQALSSMIAELSDGGPQ